MRGDWLWRGVGLLAVMAGSAAAQTAHFVGQQTVVDGNIHGAAAVAVDPAGNVYAIPALGASVLYKETPPAAGNTSYTRSAIGNLGAANHVVLPMTIAVDTNQNVYMTAKNPYNASINLLKLTANNYAATTIGNSAPYAGVAVDPHGVVYSSVDGGVGSNSLLKFTPKAGGGYTQETVGPGWLEPLNLAADGNGNVYVSALSGVSDTVYRVSGSCSGSNCPETAVTGTFPITVGVGAGTASPNVYVASSGRASVLEYPFQAGTGGYATPVGVGYGLSSPLGVAVDNSGAIYVADAGNNRVVKIVLGPVNFGSWTLGSTSTPAQTMTFVFDTAGTLGGAFVQTTGSSALNFTEVAGGSCVAHHMYSQGATCTIEATCTPQSLGVLQGSAGLSDASGDTIATATLTCTGTPKAFKNCLTDLDCTKTIADPNPNQIDLNPPQQKLPKP